MVASVLVIDAGGGGLYTYCVLLVLGPTLLATRVQTALVSQGRITEQRRYDDPNVWNVEEQVIMIVGDLLKCGRNGWEPYTTFAGYLVVLITTSK